MTQLAGVAQKGGASLRSRIRLPPGSDGPLRYNQLTTELTQLVQPDNGLIDLNIVDRGGAAATSKMTGGELGLAASSAAAFSGRVCGVRAEGPSPQPIRPPYLRPSMAVGASTTYAGRSLTPWTVTVHAPPAGPDTSVTVDGTPWPSALAERRSRSSR